LCLSQPAVLCLLDCDQKMLIKGLHLMEEHLLDACSNMKGTCVNCKHEMIRSDLDTHVCKQNPGQTIERLQQENANKNHLIK
jgi:hypothetical protein